MSDMPVYQSTNNIKNSSEHVLSQPFSISLESEGVVYRIKIFPGFIFDGASIPRALWRLCGHPFTSPRIAAALIHDWLYASHFCDRELADKIYRDIQKMLGIGVIARNTEYFVLRLFGRAAWNSHDSFSQETARPYGEFIIEGGSYV